MLCQYKNYIDHATALKLILNTQLIDDVSHVIINLYHHLVFQNLNINQVHPQLVNYFIQQKLYKMELLLPTHLRYHHADFCKNNNIQLSDSCDYYYKVLKHHYDIYSFISFKKIGYIEISKPIIKINPNVKFKKLK